MDDLTLVVKGVRLTEKSNAFKSELEKHNKRLNKNGKASSKESSSPKEIKDTKV